MAVQEAHHQQDAALSRLPHSYWCIEKTFMNYPASAFFMKDVFITSTLKSSWNRDFNPRLCQKLEEKGVVCHLPQRDTKQDGSERDKFDQNIEGIKNSRKVLTIGVNESINWGLETGYAFGSGKKVILLTKREHQIPTMSLGMYSRILEVDDLNKIDDYLDELIHRIKE